jgi:hypothetical protein
MAAAKNPALYLAKKETFHGFYPIDLPLNFFFFFVILGFELRVL